MLPQLSWLCDAMIPGDAALGHPSASQAEVQSRFLPLALRTRPDLAPAFLALVARLPPDPPADPLAPLRALSPEERALLGRFIAGAWLSNPVVMAGIGFPGFQALHETPDYDEILQAVEPVIARGPCFRQADPSA